MNISFDSKGDFSNTLNWLKRVTSNKQTDILNRVAEDGTKHLAINTPRDTGETASGWVAEITTNGNVTEIDWKNVAHPESDANVAKLIELGHATRTGGYVPPHPYIKQAMKPVWDSIDDTVVKELIK